MAARSRLAFAAAAFAAAAALSAWNPIAAPFGLVVGVAAALISLRALRKEGRRWIAAFALVVAVLAVAGSGLVLALTAGVGRDPSERLVDAPAAAEAQRALDDARDRTGAARGRAREELDRVGGGGK